MDEPTCGVDIEVIGEIPKIICDFGESGGGVIVISSYLPEIVDRSDRILVAEGGTIAAEFAREEATAEAILNVAIH